MEAKELRYKNYLTYKGKVFQVNDIFGASGLITVLPNGEDDRPGRLAVNDKDFSPIPLDEEWLRRFGFGKDGEAPGRIRVDCDMGDVWIYPSANCKYVHQLQNLYYALTGHDLEGKCQTM